MGHVRHDLESYHASQRLHKVKVNRGNIPKQCHICHVTHCTHSALFLSFSRSHLQFFSPQVHRTPLSLANREGGVPLLSRRRTPLINAWRDAADVWYVFSFLFSFPSSDRSLLSNSPRPSVLRRPRHVSPSPSPRVALASSCCLRRVAPSPCAALTKLPPSRRPVASPPRHASPLRHTSPLRHASPHRHASPSPRCLRRVALSCRPLATCHPRRAACRSVGDMEGR